MSKFRRSRRVTVPQKASPLRSTQYNRMPAPPPAVALRLLGFSAIITGVLTAWSTAEPRLDRLRRPEGEGSSCASTGASASLRICARGGEWPAVMMEMRAAGSQGRTSSTPPAGSVNGALASMR
eukprot:1006310-Prymnesium_polylepis.1